MTTTAHSDSLSSLTSSRNFYEATKNRRTTIALKKESPIPEERVEAIVKHAILHDPSPFNVQAVRAVILFNKKHDEFWDLAYEKVKAVTPADLFEAKFEPKIKAYKGGYGTVSLLQ